MFIYALTGRGKISAFYLSK